jgi:hypothetical protein
MISVLNNPNYILIIILIVLLLLKLIFRTNYFSITNIIKKYLIGFKNQKTGKISVIPFCFAFILPIILALVINDIKQIDNGTIEVITIIISILTSMFFTVLTLIIDIKARLKEKQINDASHIYITNELIKSIYYSLMFEILICIFILLLCFIGIFTKQLSCLVSLLIYLFSICLIINMFMVLKRVFVVIEDDLNN